ncbi:MAG: GAF domain-containing protein [Chloroflexi bacterium]|nr:GAF domain-containing protein [Chloroflexota bacterium]
MLHLDGGAIFLADDAQTTLTLAAWRNLTPEVRALLHPYRFGEGITGTAAHERRVIFVSDVHRDVRVRAQMRAFDVVHSQVSAPLIARDRVVGVMSLIAATPRALNADDIALVRAIGASVAVAIDHARVFETLEQRVTERTVELAALNHITQTITQSLDLNAILDTVVSELQTTLQAQEAWVRIFDSKQQALVLQAWQGARNLGARTPVLNLGEGMSGLVARDRQARAVNVEDAELTNRAQWLADGLRSVAGAPMLVDEHLVGVLGVANTQRDRYGENELRWLNAIGNAAAIAIKNAQLFESRERRATQLATLREIDHTLSSMLDLTPMLETMLVLVARIVPYDNALVLLLEGARLRSVATRGTHADLLRDFELDISHNAIFQRMERDRAPRIINDLPNDPDWVPERRTESSRAWLGAPLIARGEMLGQISLFSATPHAFTRDHSDLLLAFANHAAITIANTQLRAALHEQARRDSLTGALNHGAFIAELHALGNGHTHPAQPFALIMLDLDNYKQYNDAYGHVIGDQVLGVTVQAIRAHIHHTDLVGRWGGEEFGIALPGADLARARVVATRIRATLTATEIRDAHGKQIPPPTASRCMQRLYTTSLH